MKIRRTLALFVAIVLLFAGCGQPPNTDSETSSTEVTESSQDTQTSSQPSQNDGENNVKYIITEGTETLIKYPEYPDGTIPKDYDYTVRIIQGDKAIEIPVYNPVYASDYFNTTVDNADQHRRYAEFAFSGDPVTVEITVNTNFRAYSVMPSSKQISSEINGNVITYTITEPCTTVLKLNNDKDTHLTIFAEKPEENKPDKNDKNVIYYEAGYHEVKGGVVNLNSNQTLYLEAGAVVKARLNVRGENVKVYGRGAFLESNPTRGSIGGTSYMCTLNDAKNVTIEDVRFLDAHTYNIVTTNGEDLKLYGVKVLSNQISTDGFTIWSAAHGVHFNNCYFNISDNAFVIGGGDIEDFLVENTMVISDYAFLFPQGELTGDPLVFKNIDVLRYGSFMKHEYPESPGDKPVQLVLENCTAIDNDKPAGFLKITDTINSVKSYVFKNVSFPGVSGANMYIDSDKSNTNATITFDNVWAGGNLLTEQLAGNRMLIDREANEIIFTDTKDETAVCLKRNDTKLPQEVKVYNTYVGSRRIESKYQPYEKDGKVYVSAYEILDTLLFKDVKVENGKLTFAYGDEKYEIAVADEKAMVDTETLANTIKTAVTVKDKKITVTNIKRDVNLLRDPDFEGGLSMNWVTRHFTKLEISNDAQSGNKALRITKSDWGGNNVGAYQDIADIFRQYGRGQYKFTAWVKKATPSCDSTYIRLGVTSEWDVRDYKQINLTNEWQQIEYIYSFNGNPATLNYASLVIGQSNGNNRNVLIDNVSMTYLD